MATDAEFIETIRAHPDDDAPRLIYADWLEERDEPRGEFIRVQIQLAGTGKDPPARWDLEQRQHRLLHQYGWQWVYKPFDPHPYYQKPVFVRGFVEAAEIPAELFLPSPGEFFDIYPLIDTVGLVGLQESDVPRLLRLNVPLWRLWLIFWSEGISAAARRSLEDRFDSQAQFVFEPMLQCGRHQLRHSERYSRPDYFIQRHQGGRPPRHSPHRVASFLGLPTG